MQEHGVRTSLFVVYSISYSLLDILDLSSGFLSILTDDWASLIQLTAAHRPEVDIQQVTYSPNAIFLQRSFYKMGSRRGYLRY